VCYPRLRRARLLPRLSGGKRTDSGCWARFLWGLVLLLATISRAELAFYVSPSGNDVSGHGSATQPWQSVAKARDHIRSSGANTNQSDEIVVYLRGGRYELTNTLEFTTADSAASGFFITYRSYPGEQAVVSGGKPVTGWMPVPGQSYWVASVPTNAGFADYFRQLYVNGVRARRASSDWIKGADYFDDPATLQTCDGIAFAPTNGLKSYFNLRDLRLLHISYYAVDEFPIVSVATNSASGFIELGLQQPYCQLCYDRFGWGPSDDPNLFAATNWWMVVNAFEELDEPGEWYLDRVTAQVFYYPYSFEEMTTVEVYAPVIETLLRFTGSSTSNKVRNLRFQEITFEHGNWLFPRDYFIGGIQAEMMFPALPPEQIVPVSNENFRYEVPGQIVLNNTANIQFVANTIRYQGSCGIQPYNGARDTLIQGNLFYDLTGAAVLGGRSTKADPIPYQEICSNTIVADNVIRNIGMDYLGGTLVNNLQHFGFRVLRNDMADAQYMGFHQRNEIRDLPADGWGGTVVASNRIAMVMGGTRYGECDGGFIYSFGVWPESHVLANDVNNLNVPSGINYNNVSGLYQDNYSYGWTWTSNVVRNIKSGVLGCKWVRYLTDETNVNVAIGNFTDATVNWTMGLATNIDFTKFTLGSPPAAARDIINAAGVAPAYTNLLSRIYAGTNLARGKYAWASSQWHSSMPPSAAVDWNYGTMWHQASGDTNAWWAVDLGASYVIQRIEIAARTDLNQPAARAHFEVQGANDSGFTNCTVLAEQGAVPFAYKTTGYANSFLRHINKPRGFRYLRLTKTQAGTLNTSEFQVFGYPYTAPTTPPRIAFQATAGVMRLSWASDYEGWWLETTTNSLGSWSTLPGSDRVTSTNMAIDSASNPVFFRLRSP